MTSDRRGDGRRERRRRFCTRGEFNAGCFWEYANERYKGSQRYARDFVGIYSLEEYFSAYTEDLYSGSQRYAGKSNGDYSFAGKFNQYAWEPY